MEKYLPNSILRQVLFIIVTGILLFFVVDNMLSFLPGFLGAFCLYLLMIHPLKVMTEKWKINKTLSVLSMMLLSILVIVTPLVFLVNVLTKKVGGLLSNRAAVQQYVEQGLDKIQQDFGIDLLSEIDLGNATSVVFKLVQGVLNTSMNGAVQLLIAYLILYFMLSNHRKMEIWFYRNIPLKPKNLSILNKDMRDLVISNAVGVPLVAFLQSILAYIGYLIFGVEDPFSWFVLTIFSAMLPLVGAGLIWVPACIFLLASGEPTNAYMLAAYCFIIVGLSDNIFRLWTQKMMADIHPLITIFGVVIGLNLFGFIGIIFGPIFLSLVFWMFRIYKLEFSNNEKEESKPETEVVD